MSVATNLVKIFKTLRYFDNNLKMLKDKVDEIEIEDHNKQRRLMREALLVNKYLVAHYHFLLNDKTVISPEQFKFLITKSKDSKVYIQTLQKYFPAMGEREFNIYLEVHQKLQNESN